MSACVKLMLCMAALCPLTMAAEPAERIGPRVPHQVMPATSEVTIDGRLDEQAWRDALELELGFEVRPGENVVPPVKTYVYLTYSERALLVAFRCLDPDPERIRARYNDRDSSWNDDFVGIVIDTFNDQRRAYELLVNPLGVQIDAFNDEVGDNYDESWNAIWDSAGRITDEGYMVEMSVPFNQLRFQPSDGPQVWGFDGIRSFPRTDKHHIGLFPRDRSLNSYLSQSEKLVGFDGADPGRNIEIVPTAVSSRRDVRDPATGSIVDGDADSELGLSARWGITPNLTLNGTVNPDFSQVEADAVQLDINETFAIFFPETRPFFLEGADFFRTRMQLVHTRTIADPSAALKTTGKVGDHTFGVFVAEDDITNLVIPGAETSSSARYNTSATNAVGRYRYDFGANSTVGAMYTDRQGEDGYYNRVLSLDARWFITPKDNFSVNLAGSDTQYNRQMETDLGVLADEPMEDTALSIGFNHSERFWNVRASHADYGEDFRTDIGFIPRVGYTQTVVGGGTSWFDDRDTFVRRFNAGGDWDETHTQDGDLIEEEWEAWAEVQLPNNTWTGLTWGKRDRAFARQLFEGGWLGGWFSTELGRDLGFSFEWRDTEYIDFVHIRPGDELRLEGSIRYNLGKHLRLNLYRERRSLDVEGGELFETIVTEGRINYHFNRRILVRAILQDVDIDRNTALFSANGDDDPDNDVDASSRDFFAQLLFSYKLNPRTVAYLGYTDNYLRNDDFQELTQLERTLFLKLGYAWTR